jgi:hypothetical protein
MLKLLKQACRRYTLCVILIAHPKSAASDKTVDAIDLNDVAGGMAWNAKADHGIMVARHPVLPGVVYIKTSKSRNQATMGVPGINQMRFIRSAMTYEFVQSGI